MRILALLFSVLLMASCGTIKKKTSYSKNKDFEGTRKVTVDASEQKENITPRKRKRRKRKVSVAASETDVANNSTRKRKSAPKSLTKADHIINTALTFSGTKYKWGGNTKKGIDCSGLLYVSFSEHDVQLPRVSHVMAEKGRRVKLKNVEKGDLVFFKTKRGKKINHVGMVVAIENNEIKFIHSSSSRGVIVSSLREGYWNSAFVKATRVL